MKKFICLLLILVLSFSLFSACSNNSNADNNNNLSESNLENNTDSFEYQEIYNELIQISHIVPDFWDTVFPENKLECLLHQTTYDDELNARFFELEIEEQIFTLIDDQRFDIGKRKYLYPYSDAIDVTIYYHNEIDFSNPTSAIIQYLVYENDVDDMADYNETMSFLSSAYNQNSNITIKNYVHALAEYLKNTTLSFRDLKIVSNPYEGVFLESDSYEIRARYFETSEEKNLNEIYYSISVYNKETGNSFYSKINMYI